MDGVIGRVLLGARLWGRAWRRCLADAYEQEALRERFPGVVFGRGIVIRHAHRFYPGRHVVLHDLVYLNCAGSAWNDYQGFVRIGDHSELGPFVAVWGAGEVTIGANVHVGDCTTITAHTSQPIAAQHEDPARPLDFRFGGIIIEDHVIIGSHVTVLPGVRIGRHAMVGAGSVVTSDVAPSTLVAGTPARVIRELP